MCYFQTKAYAVHFVEKNREVINFINKGILSDHFSCEFLEVYHVGNRVYFESNLLPNLQFRAFPIIKVNSTCQTYY